MYRIQCPIGFQDFIVIMLVELHVLSRFMSFKLGISWVIGAGSAADATDKLGQLPMLPRSSRNDKTACSDSNYTLPLILCMLL